MAKKWSGWEPSFFALLGLIAVSSVDPELWFGISAHRVISLGLSAVLVTLLLRESDETLNPTAAWTPAEFQELRHRLRPIPATPWWQPARWLTLWLVWATVVAALSGVGPFVDTAAFIAVAFGVGFHVRSGGIGALFRVLTGSLLLAVALGFVSRIFGVALASEDRLRFLFLEPNQLARAVAIAAFASLAVLLRTLDRSHGRAVAMPAFSLLTTLAMLFATQSRTGALAMVASVAVVGAFLLPKKLVLGGAGAVVAAALLISLAGRWGGVAEIVTRDEVGDVAELGTFNGRTVLWPDVVDEALKRPVTGFGLGTDRALIGSFQVRGNLVWNPEHTHNWLLQVWLTTGLVGAALLLAAILDVLKTVITGQMQLFDRAVVCGLLALLLVDGISEPVMRVPDFGFVALVGLLTLASGTQLGETQLRDPRTVDVSSSISSTARS